MAYKKPPSFLVLVFSWVGKNDPSSQNPKTIKTKMQKQKQKQKHPSSLPYTYIRSKLDCNFQTNVGTVYKIENPCYWFIFFAHNEFGFFHIQNCSDNISSQAFSIHCADPFYFFLSRPRSRLQKLIFIKGECHEILNQSCCLKTKSRSNYALTFT